MTPSEVFTKITTHLVEGMMLHDRMADYYDFLGLMGFKRIHEYHFLKNAAEMRGVRRYYINHFNMLLPDGDVAPDWNIPESWAGHYRADVRSETKKNAVKAGVDKWCEWAHETKRLYEECYRDLCEADEIAAACKVKELLMDADMSAKCADRLCVRLKGMDYDMPTVSIMQDEIHSEYAKKTEGLEVSIC